MPAWEEILNETKASGSIHDVIRRKHLKKLSNYTKRNVILYYSGWLQKNNLAREANIDMGISDADKNGFMSVIKGLDRSKGLDLILHTPGGDMAATESLVDYLHSMFELDINAFIPQIAMSGGTIMALACRNIYMGKQSSIGPIDPQFMGRPVVGIIEDFKRARNEILENPQNALLWEPILRKLEPGSIASLEGAIDWSHEMARRFLRKNMFRDDVGAAKKIKSIINHLTDHQKTKNHGRHISLSEAKSIFGDGVKELEEDQKLQDLILTVHHSTIITLQATSSYKIIENHSGRAFVQQLRVQVLQN